MYVCIHYNRKIEPLPAEESEDKIMQVSRSFKGIKYSPRRNNSRVEVKKRLFSTSTYEALCATFETTGSPFERARPLDAILATGNIFGDFYRGPSSTFTHQVKSEEKKMDQAPGLWAIDGSRCTNVVTQRIQDNNVIDR